MQSFKLTTVAAAIVTVLGLGACSSDDDPVPAATTATYTIAVTNVTNAQPMTPLAVVLHKHGYDAWTMGGAASAGLEMLAESGATTDFLNEADADSTNVVMSSAGGGVDPGTTTTVTMTVPIEDVAGLHVSVASMLAKTNDAFTGLTYLHIADLEVAQSTSAMARVFDAGTEANSEIMSELPGLGGGAAGFNAARETLDAVTIHAGVVTSTDGLSSSDLTEADRWLGPAAKVTVTRTN